MPMTDEILVLKIIAERLDSAGIPYMVSGSVAMNFYARPRMTRDIDIVVELRPSDASRLEALFGEDFSVDADDIKGAIARRSLFNLIHQELVIKADMIVRKDSPYRREEFDRRRKVSFEGFELSIVTAEDLILSKLYWARDSRSEMQLGDVRNLISVVKGLDWSYIERCANDLGVAELLKEVRA